MAKWVGKKGSEVTRSGLELGIGYNFLHFIPIIIQKSTYFWKKIRDNPFIKSNESTGSGFESQHKIYFLIIYTEKYTKVHFFQKSKLIPSDEYFESFVRRRL